MKTLSALLLLLALSAAHTARAQQPDYERLKAEAERHYAARSYALARDTYARAEALELPAPERRWLVFRLADTTWRAQAATATADSTTYERAQRRLEELVNAVEREDERDRVWAEAQESLGDLHWTRRDARNWPQAWPRYQQALEWWAGARDIDAARSRYLRIVRTVARPPDVDRYYFYGYHGNTLPQDVLENAVKISQTEDDRAHAHYLLAMSLRGHHDPEQRRRAAEEFEAALKPGKRTDWYDDALYFYAEWASQHGRFHVNENGEWNAEPDFKRALELFRRLVAEHKEGESRFYPQAVENVKQITQPSLSVGVSNVFLPDSEISFLVNWRNVRRVEFALYRVDLTRDARPGDDMYNPAAWLRQASAEGRERVRGWAKETGDRGEHKPGYEHLRVGGKLPVGAYLLEATAAGVAVSRELVLVTDTALVLKTSGRRALAYFCDALTGAPVPGARVKVWEQFRREGGDKWEWRAAERQTDADGLALFELDRARGRHYQNAVFATAAHGERQAFSNGYSNAAPDDTQPWRVYAFTDRPAYRPRETVRWKLIARRRDQSGAYTTPANQSLRFRVSDPRGAVVKEGEARLNAFGGAWGELELTEQMPLGEYQVAFMSADGKTQVGHAQLFRLEEYKLPEFKVSVLTPEEDGRRKAFRLGEKVEVKISADYYFGGPVSGGTVEVVVRQTPFWHYYHPPREFPWYYEDQERRRHYYGGGGPVVKRETLKLDARGQATLTFDTPRNNAQDYEYQIEARATDSSRREVTAAGAVRVTRQRYYAYPRPRHNIYRPQDKVSLDVKTADANDQPVAVEGRVRVTRDYWYEIWLAPDGREVSGDELRRLRERAGRVPGQAFPPPAKRGERPWQLKFRGYKHEEILTQSVKTDALGEAEFSFTAEREGFYRVAWVSDDKGLPVKAETAVWVATNATTDTGFRSAGLEIVVDRDTFQPGQSAPVMLSTSAPGRFVLFAVEAEDLDSYRLVRLEGTAKLVEVRVEARHAPNLYLSAATVADAQIHADTKQVVVPPTGQFLNVEVRADRAQYEPQDEGTLTVTTRDREGRPVAAEVALGLVDESVFYIQSDYAADPRRFYYGQKRPHLVQTQSTFQHRAYTRLAAPEGVQEHSVQTSEITALPVNGRDADVPYGRLENLAALAPGTAADGAGRGAKPEARAFKSTRSAERSDNAFFTDGRGDLAAAPTPGAEPAVVVRSDFRSTVFWQPDVTTDAQGHATVKVKYPDSLTGWQATARAATSGSQFGAGRATTRTRKPLTVRLQAPRFFVAGDEVTVSAVVNNNTDVPLSVAPALEADGLNVVGRLVAGNVVADGARGLEVGANGETRFDWRVRVERAGAARIKVAARGGTHADAMERAFDVHEHGLEKFLSKSGKLRGESLTVNVNLPRERKVDSTSLVVQVTPSMAVTMLDALPYLVNYPYGCTEQTMSRFLPAVVTAKTLRDLGLKPENVMGRVFGGVEQAHAQATHPGGARDLRQLEDVTAKGLARLYDFQHTDGGWGWWKEGESDAFMTAYVVWGMTLARQAGVEVNADSHARGAAYLEKKLVESETQPDRQAWLLHALAVYHAHAGRGAQVGEFQSKAFENLWQSRERLNAYTRALLALSAHHFGYAERARTLVENLSNGVKTDSAPDASVVERGAGGSHAGTIATAHWGEDGIFHRWSDGGVEATAFALRALLAIDPRHKLVEPVTNWLVKNRRGAQWSNTRDTAITLLALNDYLRASGELRPDAEYELLVNGRQIAAKKLTADDAFSAPSRFQVPREVLRDGANEILLRRRGAGALYFSAEARFFSLEEPVTPAGNEIFVRREYFKLVGRPTLLKGYVYERVPLGDGESVQSGERIETVVTVESKNNYEYLLFEDLKPAGFEAVEVRSGSPVYARELKSGTIERRFGTTAASAPASDERTRGPASGAGTQESAPVNSRRPGRLSESGDNYTSRTRWVYQELRDRKVALFLDQLPEGVWEIRYTLRAEAPGRFHALPLAGHAMYVPEIRSNGTELRVNVRDNN